jgi:hypothetical protein
MGATTSVVSRPERSQHPTSIETLRRLAEALEGHGRLGFEFDDGDQVIVRLSGSEEPSVTRRQLNRDVEAEYPGPHQTKNFGSP